MIPSESFGKKVYELMRARVMDAFHGNSDLAHDAAVETWLAAARRNRAAVEEESNLGYFLFRCVRMAIDLIRRRREISGCPEVIDAIVDDANDLIRERAWIEVARAVASLPDFERQIIDLYYFEGFSDRKIAERLTRGSTCGDARRKYIQRSRHAAEVRMRPWLQEFALDYESVDAIASRN